MQRVYPRAEPGYRYFVPVDAHGSVRLTGGTLRRATRTLRRLDPSLDVAVRRWGAPPLWSRRPGFATLARIILEQQVSLSSAASLYARLRRELGGVTPAKVAEAGEAGLRRLGLTRQKAVAWARLARAVLSGEVDLGALRKLDDNGARERLMGIHGIGPWSAAIYLLVALGRPDIWPSGDLALAESVRAVRLMRSRPGPRTLERIAASWTPWRSVAAHILWHAYISERGGAPRRARPTREP